MYIDFEASRLFWGVLEEVVSARHRTLISSNPKSSQKYLQAVKSYWTSHNIFKRIKALHSRETWTKEKIENEWVIIDADIGRAMKLGEKAVRCLMEK